MRVLIIGGKARNITKDRELDPSVWEYLDADEAWRKRPDKIPNIVLGMKKFLAHANYYRWKDRCKGWGIPFVVAGGGFGSLIAAAKKQAGFDLSVFLPPRKRALEAALGVAMKKAPAEVPAETPEELPVEVTAKLGELKALVTDAITVEDPILKKLGAPIPRTGTLGVWDRRLATSAKAEILGGVPFMISKTRGGKTLQIKGPAIDIAVAITREEGLNSGCPEKLDGPAAVKTLETSLRRRFSIPNEYSVCHRTLRAVVDLVMGGATPAQTEYLEDQYKSRKGARAGEKVTLRPVALPMAPEIEKGLQEMTNRELVAAGAALVKEAKAVKLQPPPQPPEKEQVTGTCPDVPPGLLGILRRLFSAEDRLLVSEKENSAYAERIDLLEAEIAKLRKGGIA